MTVERKIRREMIKLIREIDLLPRKFERQQLLEDTMYYCAELLGLELRDEHEQ